MDSTFDEFVEALGEEVGGDADAQTRFGDMAAALKRLSNRALVRGTNRGFRPGHRSLKGVVLALNNGLGLFCYLISVAHLFWMFLKNPLT